MINHIDWTRFVEVLTNQTFKSIVKCMRDHPDEKFYGVAFHEFYSELHDTIDMPHLCANTIEALEIDEEIDWCTPDWYWSDINYSNSEIKSISKKIVALAESGSKYNWVKIQKRFVTSFTKASRALNKKLKGHPSLTKDFSVLVFHNDNLDILKKSTTKYLFKKLFPELAEMLSQAKSIEKQSNSTTIEIYARDIYSYQNEINQLGSLAVPMLIEKLEDDENRWVAADILGRIGNNSTQVLKALRRNFNKGKEGNFHEAIALALLGDLKFLFNAAKKSKTRKIAIQGITGLYGSECNDCSKPPPLDLRPLEKLLNIPACKNRVKKVWGGRDIKIHDIDEVLRGIKSRYSVIRETSICLLGDRSLGKEAGKRILPVLVESLLDRSANVRRLSLIQLIYWKKMSKPYLPKIRKLLKDKSSPVREMAKYALIELN